MKKSKHNWRPQDCRNHSRYGALHVRLRKQLLSTEPNCRLCAREGRTTPALVADHIIPFSAWPRQPADSLEFYQPLCTACDKSKTAREANDKRWGQTRALKKIAAMIAAGVVVL
jgi:5-methylcytosine-specific restriction enzyme A